MSDYHQPIMLDEVICLVDPQRGGTFIDGTLGGCGHSKAIYDAMPKGSTLIGIDRDMDAIAHSRDVLASGISEEKCFIPVHGNFFDIKTIAAEYGVHGVDGILLDLGVSSHQLDEAERGFSYMADAPLDMRMDRGAGFSAYDVVNGYDAEDLIRIFRDYGEERYSTRIATAIVKRRAEKQIETTLELVSIIKGAMPPQALREKQHPAKRVFQSIRIEVNCELGGLRKAVEDAASVLNKDGVLAVITFHSLEDRIVKQTFFAMEHPCTCDPKSPICICGLKPTARIITKKPITPQDSELNNNPRARSAKLRAILHV